ncbi:MAG TPA: aminotransferase class V-fold PLP-dependent enzyme [Pseudomonas sp.]|nr:aminotransferase class V-fold PLP-dependent enzyme [Pseudomonas sp.]
MPRLEARRDPTPSVPVRGAFDVQAIRRDFPILAERVDGKPLVWLDNAATTQKPTAVIERLKYFYEHENSNTHRAAHELAARGCWWTARSRCRTSRSTCARWTRTSSCSPGTRSSAPPA